jgi:hypothetical protein
VHRVPAARNPLLRMLPGALSCWTDTGGCCCTHLGGQMLHDAACGSDPAHAHCYHGYQGKQSCPTVATVAHRYQAARCCLLQATLVTQCQAMSKKADESCMHTHDLQQAGNTRRTFAADALNTMRDPHVLSPTTCTDLCNAVCMGAPHSRCRGRLGGTRHGQRHTLGAWNCGGAVEDAWRLHMSDVAELACSLSGHTRNSRCSWCGTVGGLQPYGVSC